MACLFNGLRKPFGKKRQNSINHQHPDFSSTPQSIPLTHVERPARMDTKFVLEGEQRPPAYQPRDAGSPLLEIIKQADTLKIHGVNGAFNMLMERHVGVFIDSSYLLRRNTKEAILTMAIFLLTVGKAVNCNMTFYFTSHPNENSDKLSAADRADLVELVELWKTDSWQEARNKASNSDTLRNSLYIRPFMDTLEMTANQSAEEKHIKLLSHVRQLLLPYWFGWHQRELTTQSLQKLFKAARAEAAKQPKSLNSTLFTYTRAIEHYNRVHTDTKSQANPVTNIFLLGSAVQPTEVDAIKKCQMKRVRRAVVEGQGSQFQISALVMAQHMDRDAVKRFGQIDDFADGEDDINDIIVVDETKVLERFLSPEAIFKLLNGHQPCVDNQLSLGSKHPTYSSYTLNQGAAIVLPSVRTVQEVFGMEDAADLTDSDSEDVDAIRVVGKLGAQ